MTYSDAVRRLAGRQWRVVPIAYPGCVRYVALVREGDVATGAVARDAASAVIALAMKIGADDGR